MDQSGSKQGQFTEEEKRDLLVMKTGMGQFRVGLGIDSRRVLMLSASVVYSVLAVCLNNNECKGMCVKHFYLLLSFQEIML